PDRAAAFLAACRCRTVRQGDVWADARPAGPCAVFGGEDLVAETPVSEGVVLIGDAAGYISPLIGQGLSMALRDVRVLADMVRGADFVDQVRERLLAPARDTSVTAEEVRR